MRTNTVEPYVAPIKSFDYIHKATRQIHTFRRTPLHTFVRESDNKVFSTQMMGRVYEEAPKPITQKLLEQSWRPCIKCPDPDKLLPPSAFYKSQEGVSSVCRHCVVKASVKRKQERRAQMLRDRLAEKGAA
jgi:hypothetical protein